MQKFSENSNAKILGKSRLRCEIATHKRTWLGVAVDRNSPAERTMPAASRRPKVKR